MMVRRVFSSILASVAVVGIVAVTAAAARPAQAQTTDNPQCVALFQNYDTQLRLHGSDARGHGRSARPAVVTAAQWVRTGGCLTFSSALVGMTQASLKTVSHAPAPTSIAPIYLHAGVVTTSGDDANAVAFFEGHGFSARSIGAPLLGRRIYVGPFTSQAQLDAARDLAVQAGFAYPYPANF